MYLGLYSFYPTIRIFSSKFHSTGFMGFSILQVFRCRTLSFPDLPIIPFGSFWLENFHQLRTTFKRDSKSKFIGSNNFEASRGSFSRAWISRPITPRIAERDKDTGCSKSSHPLHESLEASLRARSISESSFSEFRRIQYFDDQPRTKESQGLKHPVQIFVIDVETTGFCRETGRIIEIAILDLLRDKNSCFQTLVKPEQHIPNSFVHGITTQMVNEPNVPRMKDLIPILITYIESRQIHGGVSLFVAHNGRCFDIPFLIKEFNRCSMEIPPNWLFLDTLPLARELMKLNGSKPSSRISLQGLCEYYGMQLMGSKHRAMSDVNLLASVLVRMISDLKLSVSDLLERSFKASDLLMNSKMVKKKKKKS